MSEKELSTVFKLVTQEYRLREKRVYISGEEAIRLYGRLRESAS